MSNRPDVHVTPCYGVSPDMAGRQSMRRVAYRAHCRACGWLGEKKSYRAAGLDVRNHNRMGCVDRGRWYG